MPRNTSPEAQENRYILSSVDNALSILNLFFEHEELGTNEIAKLIGTSRSTAFRFMVTLEARGFVTKTAHSTYRLGLNMFSLGMLAYNRMELVALVHPYLVSMANTSEETCHIAILNDGIHVMFIDKALGSSRLKMDTALGYRQFAHCTATGKAILASQSDQVVNQYIRKTTFTQATPHSIKDAQELLIILEQIKVDGFACDNEEAELGLTCFAKPLLDSSGRAYAAVSISGPTTRMVLKKDSHLALLSSVVDQISKTLH